MRPCTPTHDYVDAAHLSLFHGANPAAVGAYVAQVADVEGVHLITTTESLRFRAAVAKALGKDWQVDQTGEYLTCWRRDTFTRWRHYRPRLRVVPGTTWHTRDGGRRDVTVGITHLRHRSTGRRLRAMVCHTVSHVQKGPLFRPLPRVNPYRLGMTVWGQWTRAFARRNPDAVQVAAMDSNVENHLDVWRTYLEHQLGLPSIWRDHRPDGGSRGRRLIDTAHTNAPVSHQRITVVKRPKQVDHRGIVYRLHLED